MKVALELQPCSGLRSGVGMFAYELASRLKPTPDLEFEGNLFNFMNREHSKDALASIGMPVRICSGMSYGVYRRIWSRFSVPYNWLFPDRADVTHFFNYIVPPKVEGRVIDTIHDMAYLLFPETLDPKNLRRLTKDIDYSIERSDILVTVSESTKKDLIRLLHVPESKVRVIYNGVQAKESTLPFSKLQSRFGLTQPYILYVGNLEPRKNIGRLIRAYAKLKREANLPHRLVLAGQKGWMYDDIFHTVSSEGLEDDVLFTGYASEADKAALYRYASVFAYPSLYEGFGIPIVEAMAAGVPVVCSCTSSMPEVAGDAALLVNPGDTDAIAEAIYRLLTDEALRNSKIALGKVQAAKFSWNKSADNLISLYRSMAE